jgi:hypothetical protein
LNARIFFWSYPFHKNINECIFYAQVFFHSSVEELDSWKREIVKNRVVPTAVEHWERVFKVRLGLFKLMLTTRKES